MWFADREAERFKRFKLRNSGRHRWELPDRKSNGKSVTFWMDEEERKRQMETDGRSLDTTCPR